MAQTYKVLESEELFKIADSQPALLQESMWIKRVIYSTASGEGASGNFNLPQSNITIEETGWYAIFHSIQVNGNAVLGTITWAKNGAIQYVPISTSAGNGNNCAVSGIVPLVKGDVVSGCLQMFSAFTTAGGGHFSVLRLTQECPYIVANKSALVGTDSFIIDPNTGKAYTENYDERGEVMVGWYTRADGLKKPIYARYIVIANTTWAANADLTLHSTFKSSFNVDIYLGAETRSTAAGLNIVGRNSYLYGDILKQSMTLSSSAYAATDISTRVKYTKTTDTWI
jgi:hypothetical protein